MLQDAANYSLWTGQTNRNMEKVKGRKVYLQVCITYEVTEMLKLTMKFLDSLLPE
jgi:hypothetical protein